MPSPCTAFIPRNLSQGISVANSLGPRDPNALAALNDEAYGQVNGKQSFCTVLRYH